MNLIIKLSTLMVLSACASSTVTPVSKNQFILSTSAAPACGASGAQKVASKMAAVETLRRGYSRYYIVGVQSQNNTSMIYRPPTTAYTTGNVSVYGNTAYGQATTNYYGGGPMVLGSHDARLGVVMLNPEDKGFANAIDAKQELGPKWAEVVEKGIQTCN